MLGLHKQALFSLTYCFYATTAARAPVQLKKAGVAANAQPDLPANFNLTPSLKTHTTILTNGRRSPSCPDLLELRDGFNHRDFLMEQYPCEYQLEYLISTDNLPSKCTNNPKLNYALQFDLAKYDNANLALNVTAQSSSAKCKFVALPPVATEPDLCKDTVTDEAKKIVTLTPDHPRLGIVTTETIDQCDLRISHNVPKSSHRVIPLPAGQRSLPFVVTYASKGCVGVRTVPSPYVKTQTRAGRFWTELLESDNYDEMFSDTALYHMYDQFGIGSGLNRTIFTGIYMADDINQILKQLREIVPVTKDACRLRIQHGIKVTTNSAKTGSHEEYSFALQLSPEEIPQSRAYASISNLQFTTDETINAVDFAKLVDVPPVENAKLLYVRDYRRRATAPSLRKRWIGPNVVQFTPSTFNLTAPFSRLGVTFYNEAGKYLSTKIVDATILLDYAVHIDGIAA